MHEKSFECLMMSIVAGSCSGIAVKTMTAPIDRIRIMYQVNKLQFTYRYALCTLRRIVREEGLLALFRGNSASVIRIVPYFATQFWIHEQLKSALSVRTYEQKIAHPGMSLGAGVISSGIAIGLTYPLDVARARLATEVRYRSIYSVFRKAVTSKDAKFGLFKGFSAAALAVIPYSGISFHMYELIKMKYFPETCEPTNKTWSVYMSNVCLGTGIAFLGQTLIYPLDTVRRRMQVDMKTDELTFRQAWMSVYRLFGWRGYYKAITLSWFKMPFVVGIGTATFDYFYNEIQDVKLLEPPKKIIKPVLESIGNVPLDLILGDDALVEPNKCQIGTHDH